jgi:glutathione S-transferase
VHFTLFVDGYFCNPFDATCFIALEEKQQPFSTARALLRDNQGFPPAMQAHTPIARVPALARRARARQIMAWLRFDLRTLRAERPWFLAVYPTVPVEPLSARAEREATELVDVIGRLAQAGELAEWNISHADLALTLMRVTRTDVLIPAVAQRFLDENLVRPSVKAYVEHPRPPNPPP